MIFDFPEKPRELETSEIKNELTNSKNFETTHENNIGDKMDTKPNELYSLYRRNSHSASFHRKLKLKKCKNLKKPFDKKEHIKSNSSKSKEEPKVNKLQLEENNKKNEIDQNKTEKNENNIQIIDKKEDNKFKTIEDHSKKTLASLIQSNINSDADENNSILSCSNNNKNLKRRASNYSSSSFRRNFVLKSEICSNYIDNNNNKRFLSQGKYSSPVMEYYKEMKNQFINFYLFKDKNKNAKNDEKSNDNSFGNSNKNIIPNTYGDLNKKKKIQRQIITDVIEEEEEESNCFNLNTFHGGDNYEEKDELEYQIKKILFNNDEADDIKKKNELPNENEKLFDCYINNNFSNNRNYIGKKELNNYINNNNQNVYPMNFNLSQNVYNIQPFPKIINLAASQNNNNLNCFNFVNNQEIKTPMNLVTPQNNINLNCYNFVNNQELTNQMINNPIYINNCNFIPNNYNMNNYSNDINNNELNGNKITNLELNKTGNNFTEYNDIQLAKMANILVKNQEGCRNLQNKIQTNPDFANNILFHEIKYNIKELSCDPFGNYFFQVLVEVLNFDNINTFLDITQKDFNDICISPHGTRVIQKLIEKIYNIPLLINKLIYNLCCKDLGEIFRSPYGNHVIQKLLTCGISPEYCNFIYKYTFENFSEITRTKHGVCVIQKCVSEGDKTQREKIFELILKEFDSIIKDEFGNYLLQYILINIKTKEQFDEILPIIKTLELKIIEYCKSKFSSNIIEKCFENNACIVGENILENLINEHSDNIMEILTNRYGIYILQKAIKFQSGKYKMQIFKIIQSHENEINSDNFYYIQKIVDANKEFKEMLTIFKDNDKEHYVKEERNKKKYDNSRFNDKREYQIKYRKNDGRYKNEY